MNQVNSSYGLIGHPLTHSFSKQYFDNKFLEENIKDVQFNLFDIDDINQIENLLKDTSLKGFAITIPYKEQIISHLHYKDEIVEKIGACNCVKIICNKLYGYNTDVIGFEKSFIKDLKLHHKKALVLGNGGAAKAAKFVLEKLNIEFKIVVRNSSNNSDYLSYDLITEEIIQSHQIIIKTTPVGTFPNVDECPSIPYQYLNNQHYLFDLVYNPSFTTFMQKGIEQNAIVKNGYEMLCIQAEKNWKIWNEDLLVQ